MDALNAALLWFSAVSAGIMAGVYFAFSAFVMRSLDAIAAPAGMQAMQSINRVILRSTFLPLFFLSLLACAVMAVIASLDLAAPGAVAMLIGALLYILGMFVVTVVGNVPLNNRLDATAAGSDEGAAMWREYMTRWTRWNHVRTLVCAVSLVFLVLAIVARS
ncbi:anthrone oxygenase family protein [Aurantiacibacter poecillastricola]|uniref:anthrone oxygenase family protein n=1 Tax=Aurantiacibacter poecillastricola TaxID=3064385 RepID=UPI00273EE062|nr:anthrone oxygenase family protein [Aurantiacibacter sp. 219JJ12-13]MDP5263175.1 DUF1772 domain-containing protein [Aurantiacibacter sp. 219JJ12-13]